MKFELTFAQIREYMEIAEKAGTVTKLVSALARVMNRWTLLTLDPRIQHNLSGTRLKRRTGRLASGITYSKASVSGGSLAVNVMSTEPYARIQDVGGKIKARPGSWLTVPLPAALTPVGVVKAPARRWPNTFFKRTRSGNVVLFQKSTRGPIIPLFVLKKEITLKPTKWALDAIAAASEDLPDNIAEVIIGNIS